MSTQTQHITKYKNSPLGLIPEDWAIKELYELVEFLDGKRKPIKEADRAKMQGSFPYYGASGIIDYVNDFIFDEEIILLGEDGANIINRNSPLAFKVSGKVWVNNHAHVLKPLHHCDIGYLTDFLESLKYDKYNTGTAQPKLNKEICKSIPILCPPIDEQKAIADCLSTWDKAINNINVQIAQKELSKKALMQQLLSGKKRLKGYSRKWKEYHLKEMFSERNETGYLRLTLLSIGATGIYPQSEAVKKDSSNEDKSKYKRICIDDIGYNTMRMWQGRCALSGLEGIVSPAYTVLTPKENAYSLYFSYLFKTPKLMNLFWRNSQGLVDDTLNCKYKDFARIKYFLPEKEEQIAIANVLRCADDELQLLKKKLEQLKEQKKGLMQVLLTGKKRLKY